MVFNRQKIVKEATEFYTNLYADRRENSQRIPNNATNPEVTQDKEIPFIQKDEIRKFLRELNINKVAGPDVIGNSTSKTLAERLAEGVARLFN